MVYDWEQLLNSNF